ncbi:MAG: TonB-dependent receptor [Tannerella sp.]|jgi:TonB-linked SusC/RagA family outer membrane protein|nr:TonB-dependent receptor [Tannerella sp.]
MKKHRHLKIALLLMVSLTGTIHLFAQQRTVTGTVVSEQNEPLAGATVNEEGTYNGVITDANGAFSINLQSSDKATLIFRHIGYVTGNIDVTSATQIHVILKEDTQFLDEVIVVGYGVQKKTNVSGAITSITSGDLHSMSATNDYGLALQGKAPIYVSRSSGQPGSSSTLFIRGVNTMTDNSGPLWIIDGVRGLPLNNFNEVESMQILKDAASTAIYGVAGANGVILVTTKRGAQGKMRVNYGTYIRFNEAMNLPTTLGTADYIKMYKMRWLSNNPELNESDMPNYIKDFYFLSDAEINGFPNTNWIDRMFDTGFENVHTIDISGATEKTSYYLSGIIEYDKGTYVNSSHKKQSLKTVFTQQPFKWLKFSETLTYSHNKRIQNDVNWSHIIRSIPFMNVYDDPSSAATTNPMGTGYGFLPKSIEDIVDWQGGNPLEAAEMKDHWNASDNIWANLQAIITPFDGLLWTTNLSGSISTNETQRFNYNTYGGVSVNTIDYVLGTNLQGRQFEWNQGHGRSYQLMTYLNYDKAFNLHEVGVMGGLEMGQSRSEGANGYVEWGIPSEDLRTSSLVARNNKEGNNTWGTGSSISVFGRATYAYANRYLLTANFRNDWSTNFAPRKRSAFFPSLSVGWNLANEDFFTSGVIDELKLRLGIGESGNAGVPSNLWRQEYKQQTNGAWVASKVVNENITWEKTETFNIGADFSAWDNRFQLQLDWYNKDTYDALLRVAIPRSTGFSEMYVNQGKIRNRGVEAIVSYKNTSGDFSYAVSANAAYNKNKMVTLGLHEDEYLSGGNYNRTYAGGPVSAITGFIADGIYQTQTEIDALNALAVTNGFENYDGAVKPGDLKFKDINNDHTINEDDYTAIGDPWPKWVYGFNINFGYKGLDLNMNFQGVQDIDVYNTTKQFMENMNSDWNSTSKVFDAWSSANPASSQPRMGNSSHNYGLANSYMVEDASYLKLKNLQVGYNFTPQLSQKIGLSTLRIYASVINVFTITNFSGFDPEFMSGNNYSRGVYNMINIYPQSRSYAVGINIGF